jgi:hypothetical protein
MFQPDDSNGGERNVPYNTVIPGSVEWERRKKIAQKCRKKTRIYKARANKKQLDFQPGAISRLFNLPCFYCGGVSKWEDQEPVCGVDRVDNSLGYVETNVVPCCIKCNFMKGSLQVKEFIEQCEKIAKKNAENNLLHQLL